MKAIALLGLLLVSPAVLAAPGAPVRAHDVGRAQEARLVEVLAVRPVAIANPGRVNAGTGVGAAVGYGLARNTRGRNRHAARAVASGLGAAIGTSVGRRVGQRQGVEVLVRDMSDKRGRVLSVIQLTDEGLNPGDLAFLVGRGNQVRLVFAFGAGE